MEIYHTHTPTNKTMATTKIETSMVDHSPKDQPLSFKMVECTFYNFLQKTLNREGLVFLGCKNPSAWIEGLDEVLPDHCKRIDGIYENEFLILKTNGGRTDLVYIFKTGIKINGSLPIWRLRFGDCSWISDYKNNYAIQHKTA